MSPYEWLSVRGSLLGLSGGQSLSLEAVYPNSFHISSKQIASKHVACIYIYIHTHIHIRVPCDLDDKGSFQSNSCASLILEQLCSGRVAPRVWVQQVLV